MTAQKPHGNASDYENDDTKMIDVNSADNNPDEAEEPEPSTITTETEQKQVEERVAIGANVVHETIRREGDEELKRTSSALAWSGLAAGLSMGFSLVAEGLLQAYLPDTMWRPLLTKLGYSVGFVIVVLGRQQLFTETTLTAVLPLLSRRDMIGVPATFSAEWESCKLRTP